MGLDYPQSTDDSHAILAALKGQHIERLEAENERLTITNKALLAENERLTAALAQYVAANEWRNEVGQSVKERFDLP